MLGKRLIVIGAMAATVAVPTALASATSGGSPSFNPSATTAASTTTTVKTTGKKTTTTTGLYEVIAGTFTVKSHADARLKAIEAKGIKVFTEKTLATKPVLYRLQERNLTQSAAQNLFAQLRKDKFFALFVKQ